MSRSQWDSERGRSGAPVDAKVDTRKSSPHTRSHSPGVFVALGLAQPSLKLVLSEEALFLHPTLEGVPSHDPVVTGRIHLSLPKSRVIKGITVRLVGKVDIGWPDGKSYEIVKNLDKEVKLVENHRLEKGEHTFEFSIIVPSSTATSERCQYGRIRYSVVATAFGVGGIGSDNITQTKIIYLIVNPGLSGNLQPPPPLDLYHEGVFDDGGPYSIHLQSQHIMVGGLLMFTFNLVCPPKDLAIHSVKVKIHQTFFLQSTKNPGHSASPPVDVRTVISLYASHPPNKGVVQAGLQNQKAPRSGSQPPSRAPLKLVRKGENYELVHLARMPNDQVLRPTTQFGTETPINVTHTVAVEMLYRVIPSIEEEERRVKEEQKGIKDLKKLVVSMPVELFSCVSFLESLTLPTYSLDDPNPNGGGSGVDPDEPFCACSLSTAQCVKYYGEKLLTSNQTEFVPPESWKHVVTANTLTNPTPSPTDPTFAQTTTAATSIPQPKSSNTSMVVNSADNLSPEYTDSHCQLPPPPSTDVAPSASPGPSNRTGSAAGRVGRTLKRENSWLSTFQLLANNRGPSSGSATRAPSISPGDQRNPGSGFPWSRSSTGSYPASPGSLPTSPTSPSFLSSRSGWPGLRNSNQNDSSR